MGCTYRIYFHSTTAYSEFRKIAWYHITDVVAVTTEVCFDSSAANNFQRNAAKDCKLNPLSIISFLTERSLFQICYT